MTLCVCRMIKNLQILLIFAAWCCSLCRGQMEGWRMVDRFSGFRYEIFGKVRYCQPHETVYEYYLGRNEISQSDTDRSTFDLSSAFAGPKCGLS